MSVNPKTPIMGRGSGIPSTLGHTRTTNGSLEWFDSSLEAWRPAVRQYTIRDRLLAQASVQGTYRHPRGAGSDNNVTAPLVNDLNDGGDWAARPARLFQLAPTPGQYKVAPTTVLMNGNRVMLDPFDHPIRDFANDLPIILSSEIKGWEIENYLRRNLAIKAYDLIARCPKSYTICNKPRTGPPKLNTIRERATKFREHAGLLAWDARDGSKNIQAYMLSILPPGATTTRSLGSDLSNEQVAARKAVNAGRSPNKRRKAKREAEARGTNNVDKKKAGKKVTKITMQKSAGISKKRKPANIAYEPEKHQSESG